MLTNPTSLNRWGQLALALIYVSGVTVTSVGIGGLAPPTALAQTLAQTARPDAQADSWLRQGLEAYQNQRLEAAIAAWQQALTLYQSTGGVHQQSTTLNFLAAAHIALGQMTQAEADLLRALPLAQQVNDLPLQAQLLANLGIVYRGRGKYGQAIEVYQQALALSRQLGDRNSEAQILGLLGNAHESLGEYQQATEQHQQSLTIAQQQQDWLSEATALGNLGAIQARLGNYPKAIDFYQQAQQLSTAHNDLEGLAYVSNNLGSAYHALGDTEQAITYYQDSLSTAQRLQNRRLEGEVLGSLGLLYGDLADLEQALAYHENSLAIATAINNPKAISLALHNLGYTLYEAGELAAAETRLYDAIAALESLRPGLEDADQISLFDTQVLTYSLLQKVLVAQGKIETALEVAERGRARAFVELVRAHDPSVKSQPEPSPPLGEAPSIDQIRQIAKDQQATLVEYTLIPDGRFKFQGKQRGTATSLYIWVVQPTGEVDFREVDLKSVWQETGLTLGTLVQKMRDRSGIHSGSDPRYRGAIRPGDRVRRQGDRDDLAPYEVIAVDPQAGTLTVSHPDIFLPNPVLSLSEVTQVNTDFTPVVQAGQVWQDLHQLMIAPIADLLPSDPTARVVFIPQEQLFLVPFPALQAEDGSHLIEHHTILSAPAIQILALSAESASVAEPLGSQSLVVGDPSPMPQALPPLPHSATEASGIAEILSAAPLIGEVASETAVKQQLSTAPLIHLATHGFFNESNPLQ
ncbi:MAG: CHAT domain-containing tetratricopeptide repeat protein, partial [Cyanobacteria bacterium P01_G01_bin.38]